MKARPFLRPILAALCGFTVQMRAAEEADLIFVNGNVYTANERQPHAEAIAIKKKKTKAQSKLANSPISPSSPTTS